MKTIFRIIYGQFTYTIKHRLEKLPVFVPIKEKQYHESAILFLDLIKRICYIIESEKNKVLTFIKNHNKAMIWKEYEEPIITEYNKQFMNQIIVYEACGWKFQPPGVTEIVSE